MSKLKAWFSSHGLWRAAVRCKSKAIQQLMKNLCVFQACDCCAFLHKCNGGEKLLPPLGREQLSCIWQFRNLIYLQFTAGHLETTLFFILYSWECSFAGEGWFPWPGSGSWGCPNSWMLDSGFWSYWTLILGEGFRRRPQWLLHPLWGGELPSMQWCLLRSSPATVKFCPILCTVTRKVNWTGWLVFWPLKWSSSSLLIMVLKLFSWFNSLDKRLSWELSLWANCRFGFHKNMSLPDWFFILFCFPCLRELLKWVMS